MTAELFYDLGSPYGYLAVARARSVLGPEVELVPVLLGALFAERGHGSWAHTDARAENVAEVERRAREYGLPPVAWPPGWPPNTLAAMRAATWARGLGDRGEFAAAAYRLAFVDGRDLAQLDALTDAAGAAGLPPGELAGAIARPEVKDELRRTTAEAWAAGVTGVPSVRVGSEVFYGDDRLEEAAARA
ncbi:MAG: 2-hydroxychromene-2-carboxylate isomerase [Thermoleophilaceae bacterium]